MAAGTKLVFRYTVDDFQWQNPVGANDWPTIALAAAGAIIADGTVPPLVPGPGTPIIYLDIVFTENSTTPLLQIVYLSSNELLGTIANAISVMETASELETLRTTLILFSVSGAWANITPESVTVEKWGAERA